MSTDDLLKPRYKVIADYPFSYYDVDSILLFDFYHTPNGVVHFNEYPHLFKKLEWYEERKVEDMPDYLKFEERLSITSYGDDVEPEIHKVKKHWDTSMTNDWRNKDIRCFISEWHNTTYYYGAFIPATEQEYLSFINQK